MAFSGAITGILNVHHSVEDVDPANSAQVRFACRFQ